MFCTNCGEKLPDKSRFCPACGTRLAIAEETPTEKENPAAAAPEKKKEATEETSYATDSAAPESTARVEAESLRTTDTDISEAVTINTMPAKQDSETSTAASATIEDVIGKNPRYYMAEFEKAERGEKTKFNWVAFLLGLFFCFYRKCGELFKKYFLIPVIILIAALAVISVASASFSMTAMIIGSVASLVGSVWTLVSYIRFGRNFNREYCAHCKATLAAGDKKKYGTSLGSAILALCAVFVLSVAPSVISLAGMAGSSDGLSGSEIGSLSLDGEYALIEDASSGEYFYLNFNVNGPDTLQFYSSDNPSELMEVSYKIVPTDAVLDWSEAYSLLVNNEYLGEYTEFFSFTSFDETTYYVCFSEEMMGESGVTAMMVPFSEEWGFSSDIDTNEEDYTPTEDATYENSQNKECEMLVPQVLYGMIPFLNVETRCETYIDGITTLCGESFNAPLEIQSFSAVDLDHNGILEAIVELSDSFNGWQLVLREYNKTVYGYGYNFRAMNNIENDGTIWSSSGAASTDSYQLKFDGIEVKEIITNKDPEASDEAEVYEFTYENITRIWPDAPVLDVDEDPYGITGVYVSEEIPSNRILVTVTNTDTEDMLIVEFMDHDNSIAVATVDYYGQIDLGGLELINDQLYFNTYVIGLEEEVYGCFIPYLESLDITLPEESKKLSHFGFEGTYYKQAS